MPSCNTRNVVKFSYTFFNYLVINNRSLKSLLNTDKFLISIDVVLYNIQKLRCLTSYIISSNFRTVNQNFVN